MDEHRVSPEKIPNPLYIVHDPTDDQPPGGVNHKRPYSPHDIGFRPSVIPYFNNYNRTDKRSWVIATDDAEVARNEVMASEHGLVMYELDSQCKQMKTCKIFKVTALLKNRIIMEEYEEDENIRMEKQEKLLSEWLVWPYVPKEAILEEITKGEISRATEQQPRSVKRLQASRQQTSAAGPTRDSSHNTATSTKAKASLMSHDLSKFGLKCRKLNSDGTPLFIAIPPGRGPREKYPFTTIYALEPRNSDIECLIHWKSDEEPSWIPIRNVDTRAVMEFQEREVRTGKKKAPKRGDPCKIVFEEEQPEKEQPEKNTKIFRRFLVKWTETGILTWEVYGGDPGVTRNAGKHFLAEREKWKRYSYKRD